MRWQSPCPYPYLCTTTNLLLCKIQVQEIEFYRKDIIVIYIITPKPKQPFRSFRKNLQLQAVLQITRHSCLTHSAVQNPNYTKFGATGKNQNRTKPKTFHRSENWRHLQRNVIKRTPCKLLSILFTVFHGLSCIANQKLLIFFLMLQCFGMDQIHPAICKQIYVTKTRCIQNHRKYNHF